MSTPASAVKEPEKKLEPAEIPPSPNADTDKRVSEVLNEKKKKKHPVEARIAELTAKNAKLEEERKKDKEELEKKLEDTKQAAVNTEIERRKTEAAANDKRPERAGFPDDANGTAEFTAKMAEWVIRQQEKIQARPVVTATTDKSVDAPGIDPKAAQVRKEEFDGFLENGKKFIERNPDFNDTLQKASERGLNLANAAMVAIIRMKAPEVAYYLAKPENDLVARKFMQLDDMSQVIEVGKIAERLSVRPEDFVSSAGHVGSRLVNGQTRADLPPDQTDPDDYLRKRKADIKAGIRRR